MPLKLLLMAVIFGAPLVPTFWSIFDIPKRRFASQNKKLLWLFVVSTLPFVGGMIYILFVRRRTEPLVSSD
jgi:cytochrome bd-type quinol oxidase subunit 2